MQSDLPIRFRGFVGRGKVGIYQHGILPHWRQSVCTYFVTFRQGDSLPRPVLREIEYERRQWLKHRGIDPNAQDWKDAFAKISSNDQRSYERLVGAKLNEHLDRGHGSCMLRRSEVAEIVEKSLNYFDGERVRTNLVPQFIAYELELLGGVNPNSHLVSSNL